MRCRQARLRLTESSRTSDNSTPDAELLEHLRACPECARQAEASRELRQAFGQATADDQSDLISWLDQVRLVEAKVPLTTRNQPKELSFMSGLKQQFKLRPGLGISMAVAAVVLLAVTLIPFKFDQTVGFEVAVAGVNRDLALDQERLDELLTRLGVGDVDVDVTGCEATCNLIVSSIGSEADAHLVKLAFEQIGDNEIKVILKTIREDISGSAAGHVANVWFAAGGEECDGEELHRIVIERLGDDFEGHGAVFFTDDGGHTMEVTGLAGDGSEHEFNWVSDGQGMETIDHGVKMLCLKTDENGNVILDSPGLSFSAEDCTVIKRELCLTDGAGGDHVAMIGPDQIVDGRLTAEARQSLEDKGFTVTETNNGDGTLTVMLTRQSEGEESVVELRLSIDDSDEATAKETELPEGYSLSQNYPNPFNPTTQIDFSLPQSEKVTLEIFNVNGQKVRTLLDEQVGGGRHTVTWDATTDSGEPVATGIYLYRLTAGDLFETKKMSLVK